MANIKTFIFSFLGIISTNVFNGQVKSKKYDEKTNLINWPEKFNPKTSNFYVYNEIDINASPEIVWNILIDAKKWHTFYKGAEEPIEFLDNSLTTLEDNCVFNFKTMGIKFQPVIKEFIPNEKMAWEINTKKLQAYHAWLIVPTKTGCKLITPEVQNGFLTHLQKIFMPDKLLNLHEHWLELIKARAENTTPRLSEIEKINIKSVLNNSLSMFNESIKGLTDLQLNFKPTPEKWSIAECIEHITLAEKEFPNIIDREMQKPANPDARKKISIKDEEIQPRMVNRKWSARSPKIFKPSNQFKTAQETIEVFQNQRNKTINYIENTQEDLRNRFWKHPLTGRIDLYQTLILMSAHLERHTEQINQIKTNINFPKN